MHTITSDHEGHSVPAPIEQQQVKGLLRTFIALRHRNFRLFWFGQMISLIGTWMQSIGQAWLVLTLTHSAWLLGVVGALQFLPESTVRATDRIRLSERLVFLIDAPFIPKISS